MKIKFKKWHIISISLLILFITIIGSLFNLKAVNIEDEEIIDNWTIGLLAYDSTINSGNTAIKEINYNAISSSEERILTLQVNYKNNSVSKEYLPGEIEIKVDGLENVFFKEGNISNNSNAFTFHDIAADKATDTEKKFNWSYAFYQGTWNAEKKTFENSYYIFTNNNTIPANQNFEGSFQIVYKCPSTSIIDGNSVSLKSYLANVESEEIKINTTATKKSYNLSKTALKITSYDGLPAGDYIWVKYRFYPSSFNGVISAKNLYVTDAFPEDVIVCDSNLNVLTAENNTHIISASIDPNYTPEHFLYVGYPTQTYDNQTIVNTAELFGTYPICDQDNKLMMSDDYSVEKLTETSVQVILNEFKFVYEGELYAVTKTTSNSGKYAFISGNMLKEGTGNPYINWYIAGTAKYIGQSQTVRIYDDIVGISGSSTHYEKLTDNEYKFKAVRISNFKNGNNVTVTPEKYTCQLFVRYAGTNEFVQYGSDFKNPQYSKYISFGNNEHVVGVYLQINDINESMLSNYNNILETNIEFLKNPDAPTQGTIYNFAAIEAFFKDSNGNLIHQNEPELESYATISTKFNISTYDQDTYGHYMQRAVASYSYYEDSVAVYFHKKVAKENNNPKDKQYEITWNYYMSPASTNTLTELKEIKTYELLPLGLDLDMTEKEIIDTFTCSTLYISEILAENNFTSRNQYIEYLKEHALITIQQNWKGTGQTHITIKIDFSDNPLKIARHNAVYSSSASNLNVDILSYQLKTKVSFDSLLEYGSSYGGYAYAEFIPTRTDMALNYPSMSYSGNPWVNAEERFYSLGFGNMSYDDINQDGDSKDYLTLTTASVKITAAIESHLDILTTVQTDQTNYTTKIADASCGSEYNYKLKVTTGPSNLTNLVIYTSIEEAQPEKDRWKGTFLGIDTSYAESKGYVVKTWYSENINIGKLSEDTSWKEYTDDIDKTKVKSLAFQYLKADGTAAIIPSKQLTYVIIKMLSPSDDTITTLARMDCWSEWNAINEVGDVFDDITGINSNVVKVALPNSVKAEHLPTISLRFTKEIQGTSSEFENMNLNKTDSQTFMIKLTSLTANDDGTYNQVTALLKSNQELIISQIPTGTYLLEELSDNYFDFVEFAENNEEDIIIEGVTFERTDRGYIITVSENLSENIEFNIKVTNETEPERFYEDKDNKENLFLKNKIEEDS